MEISTNNNEELIIEPVTEEIFELESLIVDGADNRIPLKFVYPGTDKTVGVYVRPINTTEFTTATRMKGNLFVNVLEMALYDNKKEHIPVDVIKQLPAGVVLELYKKVAEISGIPIGDKEVNQELVDKLMGF